MNGIFEMVNALFAGVVPIADFLWDFPTNYEWYSSIPVLGFSGNSLTSGRKLLFHL